MLASIILKIIRRNVLRQTDEEIIEQDEMIEKEIKDGVIPDPADMMLILKLVDNQCLVPEGGGDLPDVANYLRSTEILTTRIP